MATKKLIATGVLMYALSINAWCSPASTEYVKASIDALRSELNNQIQALHTGVGSIKKQINELPIVTHQIGDVFQGGMVFWVDGSRQHGLMVSLADLNQGRGIEWRNGEGGDRTINAKSKGLGSGEPNTRLIVAEQTVDQQEGQFAALLAANYDISVNGITPCPDTITTNEACYGGWYLPSVYELMVLHHNLKEVGLGQLADEPYWSSTESTITQAWLVDFSSGEPRVHEKSTRAGVRAIRAF